MNRTASLDDLFSGMSGPDRDTRAWFSYGQVQGTDDTGDSPVVQVVEGQMLVQVILQPSLIPVWCRVLMPSAGAGEAEYHPFIAGDEVGVLVPGNPRAGCCIVGKMNGEIDAWPSNVAGQDPSKNNFAFKRVRTAYLLEADGQLLFRSANTGAFLSLDEAGVVTLRGGHAGAPTDAAPALQLNHDAMGFASADNNFVLQLNTTDEVFLLLVRDAIVSLASSASDKPNMIGLPGPLAITTLGNPPLEHVTSTEAVANVLANLFTTFAAMLSVIGTPLTGTALAAAITTWLTTPAFAATWAAASTGLPGPATAAYEEALAVIVASFATATQKTNTGGAQTSPGIGFLGLLGG